MELHEKFKEMKVFFDLDGTLIDSKLRMYSLFQELVPQSKLTFDSYWDYKQNRFTHAMLLSEVFKLDKVTIQLFEIKWMKLIETDAYLKFDQPFQGVTEHLVTLQQKGMELYLVTARQFKAKALTQLALFGWQTIFRDILVTEQKYEKEELMKPYLSSNKDNWIIGDTGMDIRTGKNLGINTVAVLSGFQKKEVLATYKPDYILKSIIDFPTTNIKF